MSKSHVALGYHRCPVCLKQGPDEIIMDQKMKKKFEENKKYLMGFSLCEEHKKLYSDGFIALIVVKNPSEAGSAKLHELDRTGQLLHIHKSAWKDLFKSEIPKSPFTIISTETYNKLEQYAQ